MYLYVAKEGTDVHLCLMCFIRFQTDKKFRLEYPEYDPQKYFSSVTRTNFPVSLLGVLCGTSHELGPPKLEARVVDVVFNSYSANDGGINVRREKFSTRSLHRACTFLRRPSAKSHHCVLPSFTPLARACFSRFLTTTLQFPLGGH